MSSSRQKTWTYDELAAKYDALVILHRWRKEIRGFSDATKLDAQIRQLQAEREEMMATIPLRIQKREVRNDEVENPEHSKRRKYLEGIVRGLPTPTPTCHATYHSHAQMQGHQDITEVDRLNNGVQYMEAYPGSNTAASQPSPHKTDDDMHTNSNGYDSGREDSEDHQRKIEELVETYGKLGKSKKALEKCVERGQSLEEKDRLWQEYVEHLEDTIEKLKALAFYVYGNESVVNEALGRAMQGCTSAE